MVIDWDKVQSALEQWFKEGTGLTECRFADQAEPYHAEAWGEFEVQAIGTPRPDITDKKQKEGDPTIFFDRAVGEHHITIKITCFSLSQKLSETAAAYLEELRIKTYLPRFQDMLKKSGPGFVFREITD